jgi:hypothetical protein
MPKEKDFDQLGRALFFKQSEIGRLFELSEDDARQAYRKASQVEKKAPDRVLLDNKVSRSAVLKVLGVTEEEVDLFIERKNRSELLRTERSRVGGQNDLPNSNKKRKGRET